MLNEYSLRFSNAIPYIGQRNYNRNKRQFYNEVLSRDPTPEDIQIVKKWELRHLGLTLYNCLLSIGLVNGAMALLHNSLDKLVSN